MKKIFAAVPFLILFTLSSCTKKNESQTPMSSGGSESQKSSVTTARELNLSIWASYLTDAQISKFTELSGIKLNISNFSSNEELLAKLQSGSSGIDVAVPSDYMVQIMAKLGLLEKIEMKSIPNAAEISPEFLGKSFDPANEFSLPYAWSTTGIAVHRDLYSGELTSWKDIFTKTDLKGKLSLLDDVREVLGAALKASGFSINSTNASEIRTAADLVKKARSRVKMFRSETIDALVNKEVAVAQAYSTDANQAAAKSAGKIHFFIPEEGGAFAIDNLVIVKGSQRAQEAREFINFILSVENNVEFVKNILAGPVLSKTKSLLPAELQNNVALFPPKSQLDKLERLEDLGETTPVYEKVWTEIKSD